MEASLASWRRGRMSRPFPAATLPRGRTWSPGRPPPQPPMIPGPASPAAAHDPYVIPGGLSPGRPCRTRLQVDFRNHRTIVVVDGRGGWTGGPTVGDGYLGRDPDRSPRRDIHVHVLGSAALALQVAFLEDRYWARGEVLELDWTAVPAPEGEGPDPGGGFSGEAVLMVPSGPADPMERASPPLPVRHPRGPGSNLDLQPLFRSGSEGAGCAPDRRPPGGWGPRPSSRAGRRPTHRPAGLAFRGDLLRAGSRVLRFREWYFNAKTAVVDTTVPSVGTGWRGGCTRGWTMGWATETAGGQEPRGRRDGGGERHPVARERWRDWLVFYRIGVQVASGWGEGEPLGAFGTHSVSNEPPGLRRGICWRVCYRRWLTNRIRGLEGERREPLPASKANHG